MMIAFPGPGAYYCCRRSRKPDCRLAVTKEDQRRRTEIFRLLLPELQRVAMNEKKK